MHQAEIRRKTIGIPAARTVHRAAQSEPLSGPAVNAEPFSEKGTGIRGRKRFPSGAGPRISGSRSGVQI